MYARHDSQNYLATRNYCNVLFLYCAIYVKGFFYNIRYPKKCSTSAGYLFLKILLLFYKVYFYNDTIHSFNFRLYERIYIIEVSIVLCNYLLFHFKQDEYCS